MVERAMRPTVFQYWDTPDVPDYIVALLETFTEHNPDLSHRVFDKSAAETLIAEHFGARELAAFRACAAPAMQADYFRYCAVLAYGGIYSDADLRCIRPLRPLLESVEGGCIFLGMKNNPINHFFAFAAPGHPMLRLALDVATTNIERRVAETVYAATGPGIFTGLLKLQQLGSTDGLRAQLAGTNWEPLVEPFLDAIGSYERVVEALSDVRVFPLETQKIYIAGAGHPLPYKDGEKHWVGWSQRRSIYR